MKQIIVKFIDSTVASLKRALRVCYTYLAVLITIGGALLFLLFFDYLRGITGNVGMMMGFGITCFGAIASFSINNIVQLGRKKDNLATIKDEYLMVADEKGVEPVKGTIEESFWKFLTEAFK